MLWKQIPSQKCNHHLTKGNQIYFKLIYTIFLDKYGSLGDTAVSLEKPGEHSPIIPGKIKALSIDKNNLEANILTVSKDAKLKHRTKGLNCFRKLDYG